MLEILSDLFFGIIYTIGVLISLALLWWILVCIITKLSNYIDHRKATKKAALLELNKRLKAHRYFR